jgi:hypothetical protein
VTLAKEICTLATRKHRMPVAISTAPLHMLAMRRLRVSWAVVQCLTFQAPTLGICCTPLGASPATSVEEEVMAGGGGWRRRRATSCEQYTRSETEVKF